MKGKKCWKNIESRRIRNTTEQDQKKKVKEKNEKIRIEKKKGKIIKK